MIRALPGARMQSPCLRTPVHFADVLLLEGGTVATRIGLYFIDKKDDIWFGQPCICLGNLWPVRRDRDARTTSPRREVWRRRPPTHRRPMGELASIHLTLIVSRLATSSSSLEY